MPKALCIFALVVSGIIALIFLLDLTLKFPFVQAGGILVDILVLLCAIVIATFSFLTFRELK